MKCTTLLAIVLALYAPSLMAAEDSGATGSRDMGKGARDTAQLGPVEAPPIVRAALLDNAGKLKSLLDAGADPNDANAAGVTALMLAASDASKVKLLLDRGADPNRKSKAGRTALHLAAGHANGAAAVKLLLDKGADVNAQDANKTTPLIEAGIAANLEAMKLLMARGADVKARDIQGRYALSEASLQGCSECVAYLASQGSEVNKPGFFGVMPLASAIFRNELGMVQTLVAKGADVNLKDPFGSTPLLHAAAVENGNPAIVDALLRAGADINARGRDGANALEIAMRRGETPVVASLRRAGLQSPVKANVERAVAALQKMTDEPFAKAKCVSCHNQMMPSMAVAVAAERGFQVDKEAAAKLRAFMLEAYKPYGQAMTEEKFRAPNPTMSFGVALVEMAAARQPADEVTATLAAVVAAKQRSDGRWAGMAPRPPTEYSDITATAVAIRGLQYYAPQGRREEYGLQVTRGRKWLQSAKVTGSEERNMQLLGLHWAGMKMSDLRPFVKAIVAEQQPDGGWAQLPGLGSDAYATAQSLYAMLESGVPASDPAIRRGVDYLQRTQLDDGSWHVRSRTLKFQPPMDTKFPHGSDQFISAAATSWAVMALAMSEERVVSKADTKVRAGVWKTLGKSGSFFVASALQ